MKKLLITTTALVLTAGIAHAEINFSGSAEMGVGAVDNDSKKNDGDATFISNIDVSFKLSGETDSGLTFGAKIDLDEVTEMRESRESIWLKSQIGTLSLGDVDGALDWSMTEVGMGTALADDHTVHAGYSGNGYFDEAVKGDKATILRYENTLGAFGVALSYSDSKTNDPDSDADDVYGLGLKYNMEIGASTIGLGLGYADAGKNGNAIGLSLSTKISGFNVVANFSKSEDASGDSVTHTAIGLGYTIGAVSLHANYGVKSYDKKGVENIDGFGLNANYNLGGGAILTAGYGSDDVNTRYSVGLRMDF